MSSNVCGNCVNFKPAKGAKFFNCTFAQQGGVKYAMQVRPDTRSCEAFASLKPSPKPQAAVKPPAVTPKRMEPQSGMLCNWGRIIMVAALIIIILLIGFGAYTCFKGGSPAVTPTPTPTPMPTIPPQPTVITTTTPPPTPVPIQRHPMGSWIKTSRTLIMVQSPQKMAKFYAPAPHTAPAGTTYIFVTVTVTNFSQSPIGVRATQFSLIDNMGITYSANQLPNTYTNALPYLGYVVNSGKTISGKICFTVPNISTDLEVRSAPDGYIIAWTMGF